MSVDWDALVKRNEDQEYGTSWLPDLHDDHPRTLVGTVTGYNQGPVSEYTGEAPWICNLRDRDDRAWSIWLTRAVLVSEFEAHRPMPSEAIVVRYRGRSEKATKPGMAAAHLYAVTVDRDPVLPPFVGEDRAELAPPPVAPDIPADFPVADAEVVEEKGDDSDLPF